MKNVKLKRQKYIIRKKLSNHIKTSLIIAGLFMFIANYCLMKDYTDVTNIMISDIIFITVSIFIISFILCVVFSSVLPKKYNPPFDYCFRGFGKKSRLYKKSLKYFINGSFNGCLNCLLDMKELNMNKDEIAAHSFCLGRCYESMGYPTNALISYQMAVDNGFPTIDALFNCSRCCIINGQFDDAISYLDKIHSEYPYEDFYYTELGMIELKRNNGEKALEYFLYAINNHLNYAFALGGASISYLLLKDFEQSKNYFCLAMLNTVEDMEGFLQYYLNVCKVVGYKPDFMDNQQEEVSNTTQE